MFVPLSKGDVLYDSRFHRKTHADPCVIVGFRSFIMQMTRRVMS